MSQNLAEDATAVELNEAPSGVRLRGAIPAHADTVLTATALGFVAELVRAFRPRIQALLAEREIRQANIDAGEALGFLPETADIRDGDWTVAPVPEDLQDRRVEITGPVDRKMVINALNSGACVFMADFEDSHAPTWAATIAGQQNLMDAVAGTVSLHDPKRDKHYALRTDRPIATLMVRPRGLHLVEAHLDVDGQPATASLVDFGLFFFFHNAQALVAKGSGPYFYLPKMEHHREARLWNDVFLAAQGALGLQPGTIKACCLVETLPAAFQMHEILWELRQHSAGLNCGRWDYIFSCIKTFRAHPDKVLPDRGLVGMTAGFMRAYTQLQVQTCHRRGAHAMGGMAAQIPIKHDPAANAAALSKVQDDKVREVTDGHDGTWVAHPGLVGLAREVFDVYMAGPNQLHVKREDVVVTPEMLTTMPNGARTEAGLRLNLRVGVQYLEAWIGGNGCVPLYSLMEDAATAEISRAQVWQWLHNGVVLEMADGSERVLGTALLDEVLPEELARIAEEVGAERFAAGDFHQAAALFRQLCVAPTLANFLTLSAYELLIEDALT